MRFLTSAILASVFVDSIDGTSAVVGITLPGCRQDQSVGTCLSSLFGPDVNGYTSLGHARNWQAQLSEYIKFLKADNEKSPDIVAHYVGKLAEIGSDVSQVEKVTQQVGILSNILQCVNTAARIRAVGQVIILIKGELQAVLSATEAVTEADVEIIFKVLYPIKKLRELSAPLADRFLTETDALEKRINEIRAAHELASLMMGRVPSNMGPVLYN